MNAMFRSLLLLRGRQAYPSSTGYESSYRHVRIILFRGYLSGYIEIILTNFLALFWCISRDQRRDPGVSSC